MGLIKLIGAVWVFAVNDLAILQIRDGLWWQIPKK